MAMMHATHAAGVQQTINLAAYEDVETEFLDCVAECYGASTPATAECDEASTRASSGGSDHASSSGSEDEGSVKMPKMQVKRGVATKPKVASVQAQHIGAATPEPLPTLLNFPPGLELPPGLDIPISMGPPGLTHPSMDATPAAAPLPAPYTRKEFRRTMTAIFKEIRQARTATLTGAVERVRAANVPETDQPTLFSEMMTRAVEEMSGPGRRLCMAFVTGVAAGSPSAFSKASCLAGIKIFFNDTYDDLMSDVPKLPIRVEREFLPVLKTAFTAQEVNAVLPQRLRVAA